MRGVENEMKKLPNGWYDAMVKASRFCRNRYAYLRKYDCDELVNEAWIDSIKRLDRRKGERDVVNLSIRSMFRYGFGKRSLKSAGKREIEQNSISFDELEYDLASVDSTNTVDEAEFIVTRLKRLDKRDREILIDRLGGMLIREIAKKHKVSGCLVCKRIDKIIHILRDQNED